MDKGERLVQAAVLAALYCKGAPCAVGYGETSRWPKVWDALRRHSPCLSEASPTLRRYGFWAEAACLDAPESLKWALDVVGMGVVMTIDHPDYPRRWATCLGAAAPPALWVDGVVPRGPSVGVAGSREPSAEAATWVSAVCRAVAGAGLSVVSGGAVGVDRLAASAMRDAGGAGRALEVLPSGIRQHGALEGVARMSPWSPDSHFSRGQAMARNALLYASSPCTIVVQPRLMAGGTWAGAADALRRRLTRVVVWGPDRCPASEALVALGAVRASASPEAAVMLISSILAMGEAPPQPGLFGFGAVREELFSYVADVA